MRSNDRVAGCVLVAVLSLGVSACGTKKAGEGCVAGDNLSCESNSTVLACVGGRLASIPCAGPKGCTDSASGIFCDATVAISGQACPPWAGGQTVCQPSPSALLTCTAGLWQTTRTCSSCSTLTGAAVCTGGGRGGPDGGQACSASTCPSGCCSTVGVCVVERNARACGTGGAACIDCPAGQLCSSIFECAASTGCSAATCSDGCCANGQCIHAPSSPTDTACGPIGGSCTDCIAQGLVCNPALRSCEITSTTGGGNDGGDPCGGVPVGGECLTASVVRFCAVSTGMGENSVKTYACAAGASCQASGASASCVTSGNACTPYDERCTGSGRLQSCSTSGTWSAGESCAPGVCIANPVGASCATALETVTFTGTLLYQARQPVFAADGEIQDDWATTPTSFPARQVYVLSRTGDSSSAQVIDSVSTDSNGRYSIKVPKTASANDALVFSAIGGDGLGIRFAIVDPQFGEGSFAPGQAVTQPKLWSWATRLSSLSNGGTTTITVAQGSAALRIYDVMQKSYLINRALHQGQLGADVVVWFGLGTDWSCGSCFLNYPGSGFQTQVFAGGERINQAYWGEAMLAHEIGHWVQASYGVSPSEGGAHYATVKTFPGQAYSEGFATFHSASLRNSGRYYDRQNNGMFWFDVSTRSYYPGSSFELMIVRTKADGGMLQQLDENDVAAMLFEISNTAPSGLGQIHNALSSQHMNRSPWPQGYTRHTWQTDSHGTKTNIVDTGQASPHLGDLLDALRCNGMPASFIDSATVPGLLYPFNSTAPKCRAGACYGCLSSSTNACLTGNTAAACGAGGVTCSVCSGSCLNGVCQ